MFSSQNIFTERAATTEEDWPVTVRKRRGSTNNLERSEASAKRRHNGQELQASVTPSYMLLRGSDCLGWPEQKVERSIRDDPLPLLQSFLLMLQEKVGKSWLTVPSARTRPKDAPFVFDCDDHIFCCLTLFFYLYVSSCHGKETPVFRQSTIHVRPCTWFHNLPGQFPWTAAPWWYHVMIHVSFSLSLFVYALGAVKPKRTLRLCAR